MKRNHVDEVGVSGCPFADAKNELGSWVFADERHRIGVLGARGYLSAKGELTESTPTREITLKGGGAVFSIGIGGTLAPGLVLGGLFIGHGFVEPDVEIDDQGTTDTADNTTFSVSAVGLFVQYYIDPMSGFYLQGFLGYVSAKSTYEVNGLDFESEDTTGFGFGVGLGYDFWVADQWSIGPEFRLLYAQVKYEGDGPDEEDTLVIPALSFTGTFH